MSCFLTYDIKEVVGAMKTLLSRSEAREFADSVKRWPFWPDDDLPELEEVLEDLPKPWDLREGSSEVELIYRGVGGLFRLDLHWMGNVRPVMGYSIHVPYLSEEDCLCRADELLKEEK